jgi:hypothetical protein
MGSRAPLLVLQSQERYGTMAKSKRGKTYRTSYGDVRVIRVKGGTVTLNSKGQVLRTKVSK